MDTPNKPVVSLIYKITGFSGFVPTRDPYKPPSLNSIFGYDHALCSN